MRGILSMLLGLVRPGKGIDNAGDAVKWLWIPFAALLIVSVAIKVSIATPMLLEAQIAQADAAFQKDMESWPEEERKNYEKQQAEAEASGDFTQEDPMAAAGGIASTAALVFGVLGAGVAIVYIATFFFVAAKTWANPVKYTTMLTVAALVMTPQALRNVIQAAYMSATGIWLQHAGLGALVAPADITQAPGAAYAVLSQIDIFVLWSLVLLLGALRSRTVGIEKKRALTSLGVFVVITGLLQAVPTLISGLFMGGGGGSVRAM
ncbi:MAG: hypothetical protein EG823_01275 [Actinobacteria bacterium]|nr:hypothetical protein [Actinomycetota bacterium]